jgi:methyl-accepting chemotaxis protein
MLSFARRPSQSAAQIQETTDTAPEHLSREELEAMLDCMPINVMLAHPETGVITYANKTSVKTLHSIRDLLPATVDPDNLVGQCIDVFHKNPQHQRGIIIDRNKLPWNAKIGLGPETLDLRLEAVIDGEGDYIGAVVTWSVATKITNAITDFEEHMSSVLGEVGAAAETMRGTAESMNALADETAHKATTSAAGAEEATANVETVAAASEQLSASISEIMQQVTNATSMNGEAVEKAKLTNATVSQLAEASERIGKVVNLIMDIASQTNLLALNATIEAARAGEAGRGFAVVASEVKTLAGQTTKATEEITGQIETIQQATAESVAAIEDISRTIEQMNEVSSAISAAVEEQNVTTAEISRNVGEAAIGTRDASANIGQVQAAAEQTGEAASSVLGAADELGSHAGTVAEAVNRFLEEVKKL